MKTERLRGRKWLALRSLILCDNPLCVRCEGKGLTVLAVEVDHIRALEFGGTNAPDNLQGLCHDCHADKTGEDRGYRKRFKRGPDGFLIPHS